MNRDELLKLIEDGDFYGLMLASARVSRACGATIPPRTLVVWFSRC